MRTVRFRKIDVDGVGIFYREAGSKDAPAILLLHGFPSAGHMFRDLIPLLADRFRLIAPDLPGFGRSDMPDRSAFAYTFDNVAHVIDRFTEVIGLARFAIYVFAAPTGFRLAMSHPDRVAAIVSQNGNAYAEGLSDGWKPIRAYWEEPSQANRDALRAFLAPETTIWQYTHGVPDPSAVSPDGYSLDNFYLARPGADGCSSTYSATTKAMSRSTRLFRSISANTNRAFSPPGAGTTRSFCRQARRLSRAISRMPSCGSSTLAILPWRHTARRSRR
jgi:pimeloyl-ACP methyl ester carboxylesterase